MLQDLCVGQDFLGNISKTDQWAYRKPEKLLHSKENKRPSEDTTWRMGEYIYTYSRDNIYSSDRGQSSKNTRISNKQQ